MAKGDPSGLYVPEPIGPSATSDQVLAWLIRAHENIATAMEFALARNVEFLNVAPAKPREGMITGADGTNWNPGAGKGVYAYYTGAWHFLG